MPLKGAGGTSESAALLVLLLGGLVTPCTGSSLLTDWLFVAADYALSSTECLPARVPPADRCAYVRSDVCGDDLYLALHACLLHGSVAGTILVYAMVATLLFAIMMLVASRFFCPALEVISHLLNLSPDVAGATLLSFGNGAPDVFTQLAAVRQTSSQGVALAMTEPLGGGLFVSNIVLAAVVFMRPRDAPALEVLRAPFLRDTCFYLGAVAALGLACWDGRVFWWEAAALAGYYVVYVVFTVVTGKAREPLKLEEAGHFPHHNSDDDAIPGSASPATGGSSAPPPELEAPLLPRIEGQGGDGVPPWRAHASRAAAAAGTPLVTALRLTMPEVGLEDDVSYPRWCAVALPVCAPLFAAWVCGFVQLHGGIGGAGLLYGALCSCVGAVVVAAIYPADGRHYGMLSTAFTCITFAQSVLWMQLAAGELVNLSRAIAHLCEFKEALLGATLLSWGNSVGDLVADTTMAADGFPEMALAAAFASPLFTLICGMSVSLLYKALVMGAPVSVEMAGALRVAFACAAGSLLRYIVMVPAVHRWRLTRLFAVGSLLVYVGFEAAFIGVSLTKAGKQ